LFTFGFVSQSPQRSAGAEDPVERVDKFTRRQVLAGPLRQGHVLTGVADTLCELGLTQPGVLPLATDLASKAQRRRLAVVGHFFGHG
jgi:hypothetical protein